VYVISPNNPDGKVLSRAQMEALVAFARHRDLWILSDEVYADHTFQHEAPSVLAIPDAVERAVTLHSFSKSHALAGARVGALIAPERVIPLVRRIATHSVYHPSTIAQCAALNASRSGDAFKLRASEHNTAARTLALQGLPDGVTAFAPQGGSYLFLDFAEVLRGRPLADLLQRAVEHGVLLAPGDAFGAHYATFARLCFTAVPHGPLRDAMVSLAQAVERFSRDGRAV
jgi:aspartate/methionine/tyrosine aminotransferase